MERFQITPTPLERFWPCCLPLFFITPQRFFPLRKNFLNYFRGLQRISIKILGISVVFLFFYNNVAKFFFKKRCIFSVKSFGIVRNTTIFASKSFPNGRFREFFDILFSCRV